MRHHRQRGEDAFFPTGTDEHASKVYRVAEERGLDAKVFVDQIVEEDWRPLPGRVGAEPDFFIRTTDEGHKRVVQEFIERIRANGHIYEGTTRACTAWDTRRSSRKTTSSTESAPSTEPSRSTSKSRTGSSDSGDFQQQLLDLYNDRPDFVLPSFRYNEARSLIEAGLEDFSLSRQGQPWGVPIPWDPEQVTWVWVDALINYVSALTYARPGEDLRERYWPDVRHLIGKDILRLHCVLWPALLLAAGPLAEAGVRPRLPAPRRPEDLEDARQRDRPARPDRCLRNRPVRFWAARGPVRPGRIGLARLAARALREGARERSRQPPVAHDGDAGQVPRRAHSRRETLLETATVDELRTNVAERLDVFDITGALDVIWISFGN